MDLKQQHAALDTQHTAACREGRLQDAYHLSLQMMVLRDRIARRPSDPKVLTWLAACPPITTKRAA